MKSPVSEALIVTTKPTFGGYRKRMTAKASPFVVACLREVGVVSVGRAIDIPCGYGRHSWAALDVGYTVVAVDIAEDRVEYVRRQAEEMDFGRRVMVLASDAYSLAHESVGPIDLAIVTDFPQLSLLERVADLIVEGGYLVFETPCARGGNWRALPRPGATAAALESRFDLLHYVERRAGPTGTEAACVKVLARRPPTM